LRVAVRPPTALETRDAREREAFERAWNDFFTAVRRARGRAARDPSGGLSLAQYQVIAPLEEADELPVGELACAAGIATPTATRMLDALARGGLITRRSSSVDRRVVTVELTDKGRRVARAKGKVVAEKRRRAYESLSPTERRQAVALLGRLAEVIEEL
jgi:MarR family transcriptional regulator, organic hydroperoxide resistance regulator